ncbi:flagellar biosynthesis protein FlhF [Salinibius halmophilus]|uniref:flagellar biosynthesis protein FlhF n=1 Tax=Salinibius halmophilus TaxID=1853216 RepID=UPI000E660686|nr:flagellar biosynthesis protein FlhF [Salinibius halmophilus]
MSIKKFHAPTMTQGLRLVAAELGDDAVILSNRRVEGGVEILAALDAESLPEAPSTQPEQALQDNGDRQALTSWLDSLKVKRRANAPQAAPQADTLHAQEQVKAPVQSPAGDDLAQVKAELDALKAMLMKQSPEPTPVQNQRGASLSTTVTSSDEKAINHPALSQLGFSDEFVKKVAPSQSWPAALKQISAIMTPGSADQFFKGAVLFTGATGAGKTTTLAKLATQFVVKHGAEHVAIISADHFRIGAQESLRTIAKILGVSFASATPQQPLQQWLKTFAKKRLVLIDTSGCRDGMRFVREQVADLRQPVKQLLTVPASHQTSVLSHQYQQSSKLIGNADGVVITKLDENPAVGSIVEWLLAQRLMIHGWADGSNIPDDLHWLASEQMLLKAKQKLDRRSAHRAA